MRLFSTVWNSIRRTRKERQGDPRRVRAISGAIPRSPLELEVQEILAAHPSCAWPHLVAEVAQHLRRSECSGVLALLDEGLWGGWVWPALARQELRHLDGVLLTIEVEPSPTGTASQAQGIGGLKGNSTPRMGGPRCS
jgi:hypothetical protein